jgi:hypothetical protein
MNLPESELHDHIASPSKRDLLQIEWIAVLIAIAVVCVMAFALEAVL